MKRIIITTIVLLLPLAALCQNTNDNNKSGQKKVVNVNKLDVIYQDEDQEYQGVQIDQPGEAKRSNIPTTLMQPDAEPDEELETSSQMYRPEQMGDGVESEFDILYATMDSTVIHYASNSELPNGVTIHLTEKEKGRKFCFPTPEHARMSSHFGARRRRWHYGVDLAMPTGEPIYAAFDGIVRISRWNRATATWWWCATSTGWRPTMPTCRSATWRLATRCVPARS